MFEGLHDCGPRALCRILPHLKHSEVRNTFLHTDSLWPYEGLNNRDMNVALRSLGIRHKFEYKEYLDGEDMSYFINLRNCTFILLIRDHYTVVSNGKILDNSLSNSNRVNKIQVYHSWELLPTVSYTANKRLINKCKRIISLFFHSK